MKRFLSFVLTITVLSGLSAQTPFYIMFNQSCIDQLEYKYTYYGNAMQAYSVHPTATEQFLLNAANEGILSPNIPKGAVSCKDLRLTPDFIETVNNHTRNVYVVHQRAQGDYLLMPIISATYIVRNGAFYMVRGANYAFALDTTRLVNETNLATGNSPSMVYFTGVKFRSCRNEYSFRREPAKANQERSDFEFIPGIGLTSERSGVNAADAESNHLRLLKVNGLALDDYIATVCGGKTQAGSTVSAYTPSVDYGNTATPAATAPYGPTPYKEPNKEDASVRYNNYNKAVAQNTNGLISCPELPGQGYHVVQPGDNLKAIARTYGASEANLVSWNKLKNANKIEVCQKIWLMKPPANASSIAAKGITTGTVRAPSDLGAKKVVDQSVYWNNTTQAPNNQIAYNQPAYNPNAYNPAAYSTTTPQNYSPAQYNTTTITTPTAQNQTPQIHKVKSGDYLYKLAKQYGCAEECIRRANNMPLEGDVPLWPGQQLIIPECTCTTPAQKGVTQQPVQSSVLTTPTQYNSNYTAPTQYNSNYQNPQPQPANANTFIEKPVTTQPYTQPYTQPQQYNTQPGTNPQPATQSGTEPDRSDTYFTEHVVQQGDTVNSIAYKYKVSASELSQVNGIGANEALMPGKRLLIPHKG